MINAISFDTKYLRDHNREAIRPLQPFECPESWYNKMVRAIPRLLAVTEFEEKVAGDRGWSEQTLRNMVRRKGVSTAVAKSADIDLVREVLLDYDCWDEDAEARLAESLPVAQDEDDAGVTLPGRLEALRIALEADDYMKVRSYYNGIIGGNAPRAKSQLYVDAEDLLARALAGEDVLRHRPTVDATDEEE